MPADLHVRLQPRASADAIVGERDGRLVVRVSAPPVDGRANEALCRLLARALGVAPSAVTVIRRHGAREKTVRVDGMDDAEARAALAATDPTPPRSRGRRPR